MCKVRMLVEDLPASQRPAGVHLPPVEGLQRGGTVHGRFKHPTRKDRFDAELDLVGIATGLEEDGETETERERDREKKKLYYWR